VPLANAQETVTISKARLDELLRKEAELEKLKGEVSKTKGENDESKKQHEQDSAKIAAAPAHRIYSGPPLSSLPPLTDGQTVSAMDLAGHYRSDTPKANQRYRGQRFCVAGEIAAFEKPPFVRPYRIVLNTADPERKVICDFTPPEDFKSVFTTDHGSKLVGQTASGARTSIAKIGQAVVIEGKCKGMSGSAIMISNCQMK